jgi:SAM-dependent methyltransferase
VSSPVWDKVWSEEITTGEWDYLAQIYITILKNEIADIAGKAVLEAGSGSGRISLRLAKERARVFLLDNSPEAINVSRKLFREDNEKAAIVCASIFQIPYRDNSFDIVWNGGVIEHFVSDELDAVLKEMIRVSKEKGLVIAIYPSAKSALHTFGKFIIERMVEYPFGREVPIRTLKDRISNLGCKLTKEEYSIGFILLGVGMFKRLSLLPGGRIFYAISVILGKALCRLDASFLGNILRKTDLLLSKLFGGYLLISVFQKNKS